MIKIELFPTLVGIFEYKDKEIVKETFNKKYSHLKHNQVGEMYGQNRVHHDPDFEEFYKFVVASAGEYLKSMNLNLDNFYVVVSKSWMSFVNNVHYVPEHNHADHHLSFTYYVDVPDGSQNILSLKDTRVNLNEPFPGAFKQNVGEPPNCTESNQYNDDTFHLKVSDGMLCMFPSKLTHWVPPSNLKNERRCIAGDLLLIYKNVNNKNPWGIFTPENWKFYQT